MGEWLMPNHATLLSDVLDSPAFGIPSAERLKLAIALRETGFLIPSAYYVPDVDELFDLYRQLGEIDYHQGRGRVHRSWLRWVMCGETQLTLYRKFGDQRTVHTPSLTAFISGDDSADLPSIADELHMIAAASIPSALDAGRLFDMPIRRDPAARRPLFELIPKDERGVA